MKKFRIIAFIILIAIVAILGFALYSNAAKKDKEDPEEKVIAEVKYLESELINAFKKIDNKEKIEVEKLYNSIPTITIDLYAEQISQEKILDFNQELDNWTSSIENEDNKTESSILYEKLSNIIQETKAEETYKQVILAKNQLIKAYSKLEKQEWKEIEKDINQGISIYSKLLTNTENKEENKQQYKINKGYILLNEIQNTVRIQEKDVFLIKYKNLLEEMESI